MADREDKRFTESDLSNCWMLYHKQYFLDVLNGDYDLDEAREDLRSLIGSGYDARQLVFIGSPDKQ